MDEFISITHDADTHPTYDPQRHTDQCWLCGRGLTARAAERGWWVHMTVDLTIAPVDLPEQDWPAGVESQGWFPVGNECAKKIPKTHRAK